MVSLEDMFIYIPKQETSAGVSMLGTENSDSRIYDHVFFTAQYIGVLHAHGLVLVHYSRYIAVMTLPPYKHPKLDAFSSNLTIN